MHSVVQPMMIVRQLQQWWRCGGGGSDGVAAAAAMKVDALSVTKLSFLWPVSLLLSTPPPPLPPPSCSKRPYCQSLLRPPSPASCQYRHHRFSSPLTFNAGGMSSHRQLRPRLPFPKSFYGRCLHCFPPTLHSMQEGCSPPASIAAVPGL